MLASSYHQHNEEEGARIINNVSEQSEGVTMTRKVNGYDTMLMQRARKPSAYQGKEAYMSSYKERV